MPDNPDEARNIDVIAGRDDKGKPLTAEQVEERTAKKLEEDKEKSEKVKEQLKKEADEATKAAEAQAKADEEFVKKQQAAAGKAEGKAQAHPEAPASKENQATRHR
jgi:hypothetical protein